MERGRAFKIARFTPTTLQSFSSVGKTKACFGQATHQKSESTCPIHAGQGWSTMDNRNQPNGKENAARGASQEDALQTMVSDVAREQGATEIALSLREWLTRNPGVGTIKRLSTTSGVPYSTLKKIAAAQHPPSVATLRRLVEQGGVECLRKWLRKDREPEEGRTLRKPRVEKTAGKREHKNQSEQKVRRIVGTFYSLKDQLEFLKGENEESRELFRKYMSKRDAAYMLALLQALFSEDEFQKWIFFSEYRSGETKR